MYWIEFGSTHIDFDLKLPETITTKTALSQTIWPCNISLAKHFLKLSNSELTNGCVGNIIEIGCGQVSLPSIIIQKYWNYEKFIKTDSVVNSVDIEKLDWSSVTSIKQFERHSFNVVIGSDVFYNEADFDNVLCLTKYLLKKNGLIRKLPDNSKKIIDYDSDSESEGETERKTESTNPNKFDKPTVFFAVHVRDSCLPLVLAGYFDRWGFEIQNISKNEDFEELDVKISAGFNINDQNATIWIYELVQK